MRRPSCGPRCPAIVLLFIGLVLTPAILPAAYVAIHGKPGGRVATLEATGIVSIRLNTACGRRATSWSSAQCGPLCPWWRRLGRRHDYVSTAQRHDLTGVLLHFAFRAGLSACRVGFVCAAAVKLPLACIACPLWFGAICVDVLLRSVLGAGYATMMLTSVRLQMICFLHQRAIDKDVLATGACVLLAAGLHCKSLWCCRVLSALIFFGVPQGSSLETRGVVALLSFCAPLFPPKMSPVDFLARARELRQACPLNVLRQLNGTGLLAKARATSMRSTACSGTIGF